MRTVAQRLGALGITARADIDAFWKLVKVQNGIDRGQTIASGVGLAENFAVLLEGAACLSSGDKVGARQIHTFYYPGDFVGLHQVVFPLSGESNEVRALTSCSVGMIDRDAWEREMQPHPALGQALWRAAATEASIRRQRLVVSRGPALQRVAFVMCEQLARLEIDEGGIPLEEVDVSEAAGISVMHANRILRTLRDLGALASHHAIKVADKERLQELAAFDGRYLDTSEWLSQWDVRIEC